MTFILLIAGAYVLVCLLAFVFQSKMLYFPERTLIATPEAARMEYRDVFFETEDGVALHGWYVPVGSEAGVVLFFHGNGGNISHRLDSIQIFRELGFSVFIFDYRGYGRSGGSLSEKGTYADARAAWRYLTEEAAVDPGDIIFFGRSLGCAIAIELATRHVPHALIAESSFLSVPEMGRRLYPWLPVSLLARFHYDSAGRVAGLRCPKLFIHSKDDEIVPYALGRRLFDRAAEPKEFLTIRGDHNTGFLISGSDYIEGLTRFLESLDGGE